MIWSMHSTRRTSRSGWTEPVGTPLRHTGMGFRGAAAVLSASGVMVAALAGCGASPGDALQPLSAAPSPPSRSGDSPSGHTCPDGPTAAYDPVSFLMVGRQMYLQEQQAPAA